MPNFFVGWLCLGFLICGLVPLPWDESHKSPLLTKGARWPTGMAWIGTIPGIITAVAMRHGEIIVGAEPFAAVLAFGAAIGWFVQRHWDWPPWSVIMLPWGIVWTPPCLLQILAEPLIRRTAVRY